MLISLLKGTSGTFIAILVSTKVWFTYVNSNETDGFASP
jgi:hypothetical protein